MTTTNTQDVRPLTSDEMDIVSGGSLKPPIEIRLPGQVTVQLNTDSGCWAVWCGGKEVHYGGC